MKLIYCIVLILLFSNNTYAQSARRDEQENQRDDETLMFMDKPKTIRDTLRVYAEGLQFAGVMPAIALHDKNPDSQRYCYATRNKRFNYLCKKIILISRRINPKPAIPEEARKDYIIGVSEVDDP